jgi:P-type Ca2+ transporter type 2C
MQPTVEAARGNSLRGGGLTGTEAARRLAQFGPNLPLRADRMAALREFVRVVADPMALMLAAGAGVYFALGDATDAIVLLAAIVPVLAVDVILGARSRAALRSLARTFAPTARVIRDGREADIPTENLVPGDALLLREGDVVHADAAVIATQNLAVDESQLTGEAEPVVKHELAAGANPTAPAAADSVVNAGSRVVEGQAVTEVFATGAATRYGQIARQVAEVGGRPTPLERRTARIVRWMVAAALALAAALFTLRYLEGAGPGAAFLSAVSLAMSAVGEEFLLVLTLFLSVGAWRLARRGVLVKKLASVETLGSTTVICLDKTGTLTRGEFALEAHVPLRPAVGDDALLEAAALACEPSAADMMERKILEHCIEHGIDVDALHARWNLEYDYQFDPVGKHMSHVWRERGATPGRERIVAKGALEGILEHCVLTFGERERAEAAHAGLAERGMRVLAVAARTEAAGAFGGTRPSDERELRLLGLLGFRDPLRPEVPGAVADCQRAGIRLKLVTGDHAMTAHAIADACGIAHENDGIISGAALDRLQGAAFDAAVKRCAIFARVRPEQKHAIVEALRRAGEIVAMTGDGINDAPALRRADIGVAMGRRGTEVARAAADLVLLDDNFSAMVDTIREGRRLFGNIRRAFRYLVGFKVMLVTLALAAPVLGMPLLLLPIDLVWLEMIVHPVSAFAFEGEEPVEDVMLQKPRPPEAPIVERRGAIGSVLSGLLLTAAAVSLYAFRLGQGEAYARGAALAVAILGSLLMVWAEFAGTRRWWRVPAMPSRRFWIVCAGVAASLALFMLAEPLARLVMVRAISPRDWIVAGALACAAVGWRCVGERGGA